MDALLPPTWIPKSYAADPDSFGREYGIHWRASTGYPDPVLARAHLFAARLQHAAVLALRDSQVPSPDATETTIATHIGLTRDRWGRISRGDAPIRTDEIGLIAAAANLRLSDILTTGRFANR